MWTIAACVRADLWPNSFVKLVIAGQFYNRNALTLHAICWEQINGAQSQRLLADCSVATLCAILLWLFFLKCA